MGAFAVLAAVTTTKKIKPVPSLKETKYIRKMHTGRHGANIQTFPSMKLRCTAFCLSMCAFVVIAAVATKRDETARSDII